jgi:hypothetical protein
MRGRQVTDPSLPSDPDDYVAVMAIAAAMDREVQVTKRLIMEVVVAFLARPGTREASAASAMEFEKTRAAAVRMLEQTGKASLIAPDLRVASAPLLKLQGGDRVRLTIPMSSRGVPYVEGDTGVIVRPTDPEVVRQFAADKEHPVLFDKGGLVAVPAAFLKPEGGGV